MVAQKICLDLQIRQKIWKPKRGVENNIEKTLKYYIFLSVEKEQIIKKLLQNIKYGQRNDKNVYSKKASRY